MNGSYLCRSKLQGYGLTMLTRMIKFRLTFHIKVWCFDFGVELLSVLQCLVKSMILINLMITFWFNPTCCKKSFWFCI